MRRIDGIGQVAEHFDALIVDQFGVLHDGRRAYPDAAACIDRLAAAGKLTVVLSNSGRRAEANRERLAAMGFHRAAFHAVVTSGEIAWRALAERSDDFHRRLGHRCHVIAESGEREFVAGLDLEIAPSVADADFLLVIGIDTPRRSLDDYTPALAEGARRRLPMLCANSDLVRLTRSGLQPAPGALAQRYQALGGVVRGYGKPLPTIFGHCLQSLNGINRGRVLAVGDSLEHDILGAQAARLGSIYIRDGIGRELSPTAFADATARLGVQPDYLADSFRW